MTKHCELNVEHDITPNTIGHATFGVIDIYFCNNKKKTMLRKFAILIGLIMLTGCTAVTVRPIDKSIPLKYVCIKENPKVKVSDFINVLQDGFNRHGIATDVYSGSIPNSCEYILTYIALRSWDLTPYLSHAEIRLEKEGKQIAYAEYHLKGKGGLSLTKWKGTKAKIDPVIDELLGAY